MRIPEEVLENRAFDFRAISYNRQPRISLGRHMPGGEESVPRGVIVREDGSVEVNFLAAGASRVEAGIEVGMGAAGRSDWILWIFPIRTGTGSF